MFTIAVLAFATVARAQPAVTITAPAPGAFVFSPIDVVADIQSRFQLREATKSAAGVTVPYDQPLAVGAFTGTTTLTVTATDVYGAAGTASVEVTVGPAPRIELVSPLDQTFIRTAVHVQAYCWAPSGCTSIAIRGANNVCDVERVFDVAGIPAVLDTYVSLSECDGSQVPLAVGGGWAAGPIPFVSANLYVDRSPRLHELRTVPAPIQDYDAQRIAYVLDGGVHVVDVATGADGVVSQGDPAVTSARLGNCGVVFNGSTLIAQLCDGGLADEGAVMGWGVNGQELAFIGTDSVVRRVDLSTSTVETGASAYASLGAQDIGVSPSGQTVFITPDPPNPDATFVIWWPDGGTTRPIDTSLLDFWYYPVIQRVRVADGLFAATVPGLDLSAVNLYLGVADGGGARVATYGGGASLTRFLIENGWFTYAGNDGNVWRRAPDGNVDQISYVTSGAEPNGLSPSGEVLYDDGRWRYRNDPDGGLPVVLSSAPGEARWIDGGWQVAIGRTLLALSTEADAGPPIDDMPPIDNGGSRRCGGGGCGSSVATMGALLVAVALSRRPRE